MKIIRQFILILASLAMLSSCLNEEEKLVATAIMTDKSSLEFGIEDTLSMSLVVYADAPWTVECADWITVEPASGYAGKNLLTVPEVPLFASRDRICMQMPMSKSSRMETNIVI